MAAKTTILTNTLWNQYGTIYVPDPNNPGKTLELKGSNYNDYCPKYLFQGNLSERSVTGCSNTATAQIIYYWLQKGANLTFSVKDSDFYRIKNYPSEELKKKEEEGKEDVEMQIPKVTVTAAQNSAYSAPTVAELNSKLSNINLTDGTFVSALNFYCGIKNQSYYGNVTGTDPGNESSAKGDVLPVFKASGFESFYYVPTADPDFYEQNIFEPTTITKEEKEVKTYYITDFGYSLIRECLDYGEPVFFTIEGHDIYIDGYEKQVDGTYKYHLNYGWGGTYEDGVLTPDSKTKWYTADDITKEQPEALLFDLDPDLSVKVTNDSSEFVAGSMLRGLERIDNVQKAKTVSVSFDESLAGKTISLEKAWTTSDGNKCGYLLNENSVNFSFTSFDGFYPAANLILQKYHGFTVVNSDSNESSSHQAFVVTDNGTLNAEISGGGVFSATTDEDNADILEALQDYGKTGVSAVEDYIELLGKDYAFSAEKGNDTVSIVNDAIVMGDIHLGTGNNVITIDNSSLWVGDLASAASVNLVMNKADEEASIYLRSGKDLEFAENASLTVILADPDEYTEYYLINTEYASDETVLDDITIDVKSSKMSIVSSLGIGEFAVCGLRKYELIYDDDILSLDVSEHDSIYSDFNLTGKSDIAQLRDDQYITVTYDSGSSFVKSGDLWGIGDWDIVEFEGYYKGNGYADVLMTHNNTDNNTTTVGYLANQGDDTITFSHVDLRGYSNTEWNYLGIADVNGDGITDVLTIQTDTAAGANDKSINAWIFNTAGNFTGDLRVGGLNSEWSYIGEADVLGNGVENLLLQHESGQVSYWAAAGSDMTMIKSVQDRDLIGTGDFDGDGKGDILWKYDGDDTLWSWTHVDQGENLTDTRLGQVSELAGSWTFDRIGDYDGDGSDEILWGNADGQLAYSKANSTDFKNLTTIA